MSSPSAALVVGEALVDIVRTGNEVRHLPGGSCANVAVALARVGRPVVLATSYGDDSLGQLLEKHLGDSGVAIRDGSRRAGTPTSTAEADLSAGGSASYSFHLTWDIALDDLKPAHHPVIHVGSIGAHLLPGADAVERAVHSARKTATVSYDLNARPALFGDPAEARKRVARLVAATDIAKASDEDLAWLYPESTVEEAAMTWLELGAAGVLITRGASGARVFTPAGQVDTEGVRVPVVDTIGAGDTFSAAIIDGLWEMGLLGAQNRDQLRALALADWQRVLTYATHAAAVVVSRPGADPPYPQHLPPKPTRAAMQPNPE